MEYHRVASTAQVPVGKMKKVNAKGKDVVVANAGGAYCALGNACPHSGGSLADGALNGEVVTCPKHGAQFNVKTGEAVGKAKVALFKISTENAKMHPVKIENDNVHVGVE